MRTAWWSRLLSSFLVVVFLTAQVRPVFADVENGAVAETYNFQDITPLVRGAAAETSRSGSHKARKVPVSASGSLEHTIAIEVPPGRLGITPSLALSYDS